MYTVSNTQVHESLRRAVSVAGRIARCFKGACCSEEGKGGGLQTGVLVSAIYFQPLDQFRG